MKALVTGATGFLGGALARRLHSMGWDVTAAGRSQGGLAELHSLGIQTVQAELSDGQAILRACKDQEIVFHCGAFSSPWGKSTEFYTANVLGTENVIRACMENQVNRLAYVSTPSVYFRYEPRLNVREDAELPPPVNEYSRTKQMAEAKIDAAFNEGLPVVTIRPRGIFGPRDTSILPRLIQRLQSGRMRIIGDGENITDMTFVENVVDALVLCAESPAENLGKKYNITNGEPFHLWRMIERVCGQLNLEFPARKIPYNIAHNLAAVLEAVYRALPSQPEPPLTCYSVFVISQNATLDISAAKKELGYQPKISMDEGFEKFVRWWQEKK
jgi:nucleoside-diphosphate-sugar epimerase